MYLVNSGQVRLCGNPWARVDLATLAATAAACEQWESVFNALVLLGDSDPKGVGA